MKLTLGIVKTNLAIKNFIKQTEKYLDAFGYTDHGFRHVNIAADRAKAIGKKIGISAREQELAAVAAYCHDMANFLGRDQHHYWAALLFFQIFLSETDNPDDVSTIAQAIVSHDKQDLKIISKVSALLVLADKSDVHRSRVRTKIRPTQFDIHDRVNYAVIGNDLLIDPRKRLITLRLKLDTKFSAPLEYFEIFTDRMTFCRLAAQYLGYKFSLEINKFKLL